MMMILAGPSFRPKEERSAGGTAATRPLPPLSLLEVQDQLTVATELCHKNLI